MSLCVFEGGLRFREEKESMPVSVCERMCLGKMCLRGNVFERERESDILTYARMGVF